MFNVHSKKIRIKSINTPNYEKKIKWKKKCPSLFIFHTLYNVTMYIISDEIASFRSLKSFSVILFWFIFFFFFAFILQSFFFEAHVLSYPISLLCFPKFFFWLLFFLKKKLNSLRQRLCLRYHWNQRLIFMNETKSFLCMMFNGEFSLPAKKKRICYYSFWESKRGKNKT